jgi:hypothetical protein
MNNTVALVEAYLHVNGYPRRPSTLSPRRQATMITDR